MIRSMFGSLPFPIEYPIPGSTRAELLGVGLEAGDGHALLNLVQIFILLLGHALWLALAPYQCVNETNTTYKSTECRILRTDRYDVRGNAYEKLTLDVAVGLARRHLG